LETVAVKPDDAREIRLRMCAPFDDDASVTFSQRNGSVAEEEKPTAFFALKIRLSDAY
tara:strand:- start:205 stop:378 length:174 start_codon:yes stop_codon:yes gene_type:complete